MPLVNISSTNFDKNYLANITPSLKFFGILKNTMLALVISLYALTATCQVMERPTLAAGVVEGDVRIDGLLDEPSWAKAPVLDSFLTTVPVEKGQPSARTLVRVLADEKFLIIGIDCQDQAPEDIVRFSKIRDADIDEEDHVKIV
ncbi:MAG: hypothetical protein KJP14_11430, partial [Eudoraea sp.]|nr:hypothetical protein [Eudoraea sp.]